MNVSKTNFWNTTIILMNRFVALVVDYGYLIALGLIFAKISISFVMIMWIAKALGDLIAVGINNIAWIVNHPTSYVLFISELIKGCLIISCFFLLDSFAIFALIVVIEVLNTLFGSLLAATVPRVIEEGFLKKFNSLYTTVGSISYFFAPVIVGLSFYLKNDSYLFIVYGIITMLSACLLVLLPAIKISHEKYSASFGKRLSKSIQVLKKLNDTWLLRMVWIAIITEIFLVVFDSYEVIYLTNIVGMSERVYSFSLSYLAVVYIAMASIYYFFNNKFSSKSIYLFGTCCFFFYMVLFTYGSNTLMIIFSFTFLAIGQTLMGLEVTNNIQKKLTSSKINQLYLVQDTIQSVASTVVIILIGISPIRAESLRHIYFVLLLFFILLMSILIRMKSTSQKNEKISTK